METQHVCGEHGSEVTFRSSARGAERRGAGQLASQRSQAEGAAARGGKAAGGERRAGGKHRGCRALPGRAPSPGYGDDSGWEVTASLQELPVFRARAFPTAPRCPWGPPVRSPPSSPHGSHTQLSPDFGNPHSGEQGQGLCFLSPPWIKADPPPSRCVSPLAVHIRRCLPSKGFSARGRAQPQPRASFGTAGSAAGCTAPGRSQPGQEGRGGGSPPSLKNLNCMRKQRQIMERRAGEEDASHGAACRRIPVWKPLPAAFISCPTAPCPPRVRGGKTWSLGPSPSLLPSPCPISTSWLVLS